MKPINEKERTLAFIQFLVLFILTVILTIFFVFGDQSISKKGYEVLKEENKKLKEEESFIRPWSQELDSISNVVKGMDKMEETQYDLTKDKIVYKLNQWVSDNSDTSSIGKVKNSVKEITTNWVYDKKKFLEFREMNQKIEKLEAEKKDMERDYKNLLEKYDNLNRGNN